jgi:hypothetical protein
MLEPVLAMRALASCVTSVGAGTNDRVAADRYCQTRLKQADAPLLMFGVGHAPAATEGPLSVVSPRMLVASTNGRKGALRPIPVARAERPL